ncbi:MAG: Gfo/Idh/MocA family protein [Conexibacter sp.]
MDHILWMAGPATAVSGSVSASMPELPQFDNTMGAVMHLASGATAQLHASWAATVAAGQRGALGTRGTILLEGDSIWTISRVRMRTARDEAEQVFELGGSAATDMGYRALAEHFVACIREDREPQPGLRAGLAALDVSLGVLTASRARSVVALPERD